MDGQDIQRIKFPLVEDIRKLEARKDCKPDKRYYMNYYKSIVDCNGYAHYCDNVIVKYLVKNFNIDGIVKEFYKIKELINPEVYWGKLYLVVVWIS